MTLVIVILDVLKIDRAGNARMLVDVPANEMVAASVSEIAGKLRITAPLSFGVQRLTKVPASFARTYPMVELDVSFDDKVVDLVGGGFDLAIRIVNPADSSLVA